MHAIRKRGARALRLLAVCLPACAAPGAWAAEEVAATPYRPTVSNPAELSAPGWIEFEFGMLRQRAGEARRRGTPYAAKLAFDEDWGVILGGELRASDRAPGGATSSGGDTMLTLKHRIATADERHNFGVEATLKLPTARPPIGSGHADWSLAGIYSADFAPDWRLDANLGATRQGAAVPEQGRMAWPWAAAVSRVAGPWTFAGELSGVQQRGVPAGSQWLLAAAYTVTQRLVVDGGVLHGMQDWRAQRGVFIGATWLGAKVF